MINHARTLLLNRKPDNVAYGGLPGDEYMPVDFAPLKKLPTYLKSIRAMLLGSDPDRLFGNYRAQQYLSLLHATELVEFVTDLDPRITYDLGSREFFDDSMFTATVSHPSLQVLGDFGSPDGSGRSRHEWDVNILTGSTVEIARQTKPQQHSVQDYTFTDGMSNQLPLVGSTAKFRIKQSTTTTWAVSGYARPSADLGSIMAEIESVGERYMNDLFGVGTAVGGAEPFKTFRNLWADHPELPYRLGGVLLAVIYRLEGLRNDG